MTQPTKREQLAAMRLEDFKAHLRTIAGASGQIDKTDAIQLVLERTRGDAVDVFVPYAQLPDGTFTYGELFACERTPSLFVPQHQET
jgi:hypothetical protein